MSLDDLNADVTAAYSDLGDELRVDLDRETRNELAMLLAAFDGNREELVRRAIHALYRSTVGQRERKASQASTTRSSCVCWLITSETRIS